MLNIFVGIGNLVRDIELNKKGDSSFTHNAIAIQRNFTNKKSGEIECDYIAFKAFGKNADYLAKYAKKGSKVCIVGRWVHEFYTSKNGERKVSDNVNVDEIYILGRVENVEPKVDVTEENNLPDISDDDMPF